MADDPIGGPASGLSFRDVVDMVRDDAAAAELRATKALEAMEARVMGAIGGVRGDLGKYIETHAGDHVAMRTTTEVAHNRYDAFISANAIDNARRDGALGIVRYVVDLLGRNWKALAATALGIAAATGSLHISIGA